MATPPSASHKCPLGFPRRVVLRMSQTHCPPPHPCPSPPFPQWQKLRLSPFSRSPWKSQKRLFVTGHLPRARDSPTCLDARRVHSAGSLRTDFMLRGGQAHQPSPPTDPTAPQAPLPLGPLLSHSLPQSQPCPPSLHLSRSLGCCLWAAGNIRLPRRLPLWWGSPASFL